MSLAESIEKVGTSVVTAIVLFVGTAVAWIVRNVLTQGHRLELLEAEARRRDDLLEMELKRREQQRNEDREALSEVRDAVKRIEGVMITRGGN